MSASASAAAAAVSAAMGEFGRTAAASLDSAANTARNIAAGNARYFETANVKFEEIKKQLDSKSDKDKMEGMKRLIAMISKGRDVSSLFPDVVKNVVSHNHEVKRLVYMYLVHYAEVEPEPALLAINTIQKDLDSRNQLTRAHALRTMSSIRLRVIVQIVMMAIKNSITDSSPYVRKAAAHAIPKVYSLDPEQKDNLIEIIESLLRDSSNMVLGSAVAAFNEICPEQWELIHPHYRKLCNQLADTDEWGQITILHMLTRYARTQFVDPDRQQDGNKADAAAAAAEDDDDDPFAAFGRTKAGAGAGFGETLDLDSDHRLLLKAAAPLLNSRNNGVVMAVATLYFYLAPKMEALRVGKGLARVLRISKQREVQYVVLMNIATMASMRPTMFTPYVADFFVSDTDPSFNRALKLEILTYLADEGNISRLLREFIAYIHQEDKEFAAGAIQAIGRCATRVPEVADTCMQGLVGLLTNRSETVVAESVIVIKKLLQTCGADKHVRVVQQLAKTLDKLAAPAARASVLWVVGEYCDKIPTVAPDVLRVLAKSFPDEDETVRAQVLNLAAKLLLANPAQTRLLFTYVLNMAKYDTNYDIRDRARLMRKILQGAEDGTAAGAGVPHLSAAARQLFLTSKPVPVVASAIEDRQRFALGSLSHLVNHTVSGYQAIPDYAATAPDRSVRDVKTNLNTWDTPASISSMSSASMSSSSASPAAFGGNVPARRPAAAAHAGDLESFLNGTGGDEDAGWGDDDEGYDEDGGYYDEEGYYYDQYGGYYDPEGNYFDADGNPADEPEAAGAAPTVAAAAATAAAAAAATTPVAAAAPAGRPVAQVAIGEADEEEEYGDEEEDDGGYYDEHGEWVPGGEAPGGFFADEPEAAPAAVAAAAAPAPAPAPAAAAETAPAAAAVAQELTPAPEAAVPPPRLADTPSFSAADLAASVGSNTTLTAFLASSPAVPSPLATAAAAAAATPPPPAAPTTTATTTTTPPPPAAAVAATPIATATASTTVLLPSEQGDGLQIEYSYLRSAEPSASCTLQLTLRNAGGAGGQTVRNVTLAKAADADPDTTLESAFEPVAELAPGAVQQQTLAVTFSSTAEPVALDIGHSDKTFGALLTPEPGELLNPGAGELSAAEFGALRESLLDSSSDEIVDYDDAAAAVAAVLRAAAVRQVTAGIAAGELAFCATTKADNKPLIVVLQPQSGASHMLTLYCEDSILASMLLASLKAAFAS